jgi:NAD(P)-dependent dehydrogenase (short-subunit alcohol dehydrogenase family)
VLNAGQTQRSVVVETPADVVRRIMELNYLSVVSLTQAVLPHMLARGSGHLLVTSSFSGLLGACCRGPTRMCTVCVMASSHVTSACDSGVVCASVRV